MPEPLYTIFVSNEPFKFTRSQLESELDNYFLTYFFGSFAEASQGADELHVEKEPILFKLIQAHLRGYNIFPIADGCVPSYMTKEVMVENLLMEAEFYGLKRLVGRIKDYQTEIREIKSSSDKKYMMKAYYAAKVQRRYLDREEYLALLHGLIADSTSQYMVVSKLQDMKEEGYFIRLKWVHKSVDYALLVSEDPSTRDEAIPRPAQAN